MLITVGVALRAAVILLGLLPLNSDEATMGLMAWHVAQGRHLPVFFYGQDYMGAVEAYLAAPLFALFGPATPFLRLQALVWFVLLASSMYRLATIVYSRRIALLTVALLLPISDRILFVQVRMAGGYPEIAPMSALLMLGAVLLARRRKGPANGSGVETGDGQRRVTVTCARRLRRSRTAGYAAWGFLAGFALWDDWLVLPYLAAAALLVAAFCWRELLGRAGVAAAIGVVAGAAPLWLANLVGHAHSIRTFLFLNGMHDAATTSASWLEHLRGGVIVAIPLAAGLCPSRCASVSTWWGPMYLTLLIAAGILALVGLRLAVAGRTVRVSGPDRGMRFDARLTHATRLALVVAAALTLWSFARSPAAVLTADNSSRYLSILVVSSPVVLWPLVAAPALVRRWGRWATLTTRALGTGILATLLSLMLVATVTVFQETRYVGGRRLTEKALVGLLDQLSISGVYSDYWTCNLLVFGTRERIVCAVVEDDLRRGQNRCPQYWTKVAAASRKAYIVRATSAARAAVAGRYPGVTPITVGGVLIYPVP